MSKDNSAVVGGVNNVGSADFSVEILKIVKSGPIFDDGCQCGSFEISETLNRTKAGTWFVSHDGEWRGNCPLFDCNKIEDNETDDTMWTAYIKPMTDAESFEWLSKNDAVDVVIW